MNETGSGDAELNSCMQPSAAPENYFLVAKKNCDDIVAVGK
jgi:hypothetical protein